MATIFEQLIVNLQSIGFFRFFLPMVFIFAVTYGILQRIELFEDENVDAVTAAVVAFISLLGIYTFDLSGVIVRFLGVLSIAMVVLLGLAIIAGMLGVNIKELDYDENLFVVAGLILVVLLIIVFSGIPGLGNVSESIVAALGSEPAMMLYTIVGIGLVLYWITED